LFNLSYIHKIIECSVLFATKQASSFSLRDAKYNIPMRIWYIWKALVLDKIHNMKRIHFILYSFLCFFVAFSVQAQCPNNEANVVINILTDTYPQETTWMLTYEDGTVIASDALTGEPQSTLYQDSVCVPIETCLLFTIFDTNEDGICCGYGIGNYSVVYDEKVVAEGGNFGLEEESVIGCPLGTYCDTALPIDVEENYTATFLNTWYVFESDAIGQFEITTCSFGNACNTGIWIYDYCLGLDWDDSPEGAIYFSNTGCDNTDIAYLNATLFDDTYYIRIGDMDGSCDDVDIQWAFSYKGAPEGCIDLNACNYNPIAVVDDGSCLYQGNPNCPEGPDLIVLDYIIANTLVIQEQENNEACYTEEQCLTGYGTRQILRFTTHIENIGDQDYYIGIPPADQNGDGGTQWEWDPCHGHWHYEGYAEYILYDQNNNELPIGFKNGFCVLDLDCSYGGGTPKYSCANQGISAHCGDIYSSGLECQWIDITEVVDGIYTLVVRVNWDKSADANGVAETNYSNNWAQVCINLQTDAAGTRFTQIVTDCQPYTDCLGEIYGAAQLDCEGNCAGSALRGDFTHDEALDDTDVQKYLKGILIGEETTDCIDLNQDGCLTVTDAVLLQECLLEGIGVVPVNGNCEFPFGLTNTNDTVTFNIENIDFTNRYIDFSLKNPYNLILGFELSIAGIMIDSVEMTYPTVADYALEVDHNFSIFYGIITDGNPIPKNTTAVPFLRVHFKEQAMYDTPFFECFKTVVNEDREEVVVVVVP